jgi:hypothetical protein
MNYLPENQIELTKEQADAIEYLVAHHNIGGLKLNTRVIYQLWQQFFGVRKVPNGCGACHRTDLLNFVNQYNELKNIDKIVIKNND